MTSAAHVYIHIPFCARRCAYCGFFHEAYDAARADAFLSALEREPALRGPLTARTLYIGGGSPSVLSVRQWARLGALLRDRVALSAAAEWTVEVHPGDVTAALLDHLAAAGVNRISMGVQSLDGAVLAAAGRRDTPEAVAAAVAAVRRAGFTNLGLDLIAGLPGESAASWRASVAGVAALAPEHVSLYMLEGRAGRRAGSQTGRPTGRPRRVAGAARLRRLTWGMQWLAARGYVRYEISNAARPGYACRHHVACWEGNDYVGCGPGAASRAGRRRWTNAADLDAYLAWGAGGTGPAPAAIETLDRRTDLVERYMFTFRLCGGVACDAFYRRWAVPPSLRRAWERTCGSLAAAGLLASADGRRFLTAPGIAVADAVMAEIAAAAS